jgi:hypothetical protein
MCEQIIVHFLHVLALLSLKRSFVHETVFLLCWPSLPQASAREQGPTLLPADSAELVGRLVPRLRW